MAVYIQETIAIGGGGKEAYLESVRSRWAPIAERTRGMRLFWIGSTIGSTAAWPEAVVVWELRDWSHYAEVCSRMYTESSDDRELVSWWQDVAKLRRRSRSRTLVGASFSPTLDQLIERSVSGAAFALSTYRVQPGKAGALLAELERQVAGEEERGRRLVGAYEVAFTNDRACAIWAHATLADLAGFERGRGARPQWMRSLGGVVEGWSEHWGFAAPETPLSPKPAAARVW